MSTTVRHAMNALLSVCDGATSEDGQGFNKFDSYVAQNMASKKRWTHNQEKAMHKMLRKYRNQLLSTFEICHEELTFETTPEDTKEKYRQERTKTHYPTLSFDGKEFVLKSPFSFRERAKSIPSKKWNPDDKTWRYRNADYVLDALAPMVQSGEILADTAATALINHHLILLEEKSQQLDEVKEIKQGHTPDIPVPLKTSPFDHQRQAFYVATTLPNTSMLMEQGTGKTLVAIAAAGHRYLSGEVRRLLVIAPLSVVPVWKKEFDKHADFPVRIEALTNGKTADKEQMLKTWKDTDALQVVVINYESTWRAIDGLAAYKPQMIILDESQKIKNSRAKQSRAIHQLGRLARYRMILTGTPVTQAPTDFFSQYKFLDPSIFGTSFPRFRNNYCVMGGWQGKEIIGFRNLDHLAQKAHSIAYRVTKAEALDLPQAVDQTQYCFLKESSTVYRQMEDKFVAEVENGAVVTAPIMLTKLLRLQQITGGFLPTTDEFDNPTGTVSTGTEKLNLMKQVLEEVPQQEKVVIFARFIPEIDAIAAISRELGRGTVTLTGKTKDRGEVVNQFQQDPSTTVIVIQIQTGGLGITLTAAATAVFYSMNFSYADYEQAKARIHRIGQTRSVNYIHLIAEGTIDEDIYEAVQQKKDVATLVVDKLKHKGLL